jgi:predicted metal-dependent phosphotriesterase family hydrolase
MAIITVKGPIPAEQAGYTLSHEHLLCDLWRFANSYDNILDDESLAIRELAEYRQAGGACLVDATSCGLGRNPSALRRISEASGIHIVMGSGWYRERVYPALVYERDTNALADLIVEEVTTGAEGTGVRAGIIGEIGTERYHITPAQERVFRAAARAQRRTGACIMTHTTHFGELALEQIALLREEGVNPSRIVISHLGDRYDATRLLEIARHGVYLSVDNIGYTGSGYPPDEVRARNVGLLAAEGHLGQVVLGGDVCLKTHLRAYGGKGYAHVIQRFLPILRTQDLAEEAIHQMTVINPARMLDVTEESAAPPVYAETARHNRS